MTASRLPDPAPGVSCWTYPLDAAHTGDDALLSPEELRRAARFGTPALRARYVRGRAGLRCILAAALSLRPQEVPIVRGTRGRPYLGLSSRNFDFNVSHTRDVAVVAFTNVGRVGIDIEHAERACNVERLARRVLSGVERNALEQHDAPARRDMFLRLWTCKEAIAKATGAGLSAPFREITVDLDSTALIEGPAPYCPAHWHLHTVGIARPYLATVALWRPSPA